MQIADKSRNIPSLDGLRAISILLVILGHSSEVFSHWTRIPERSYLYLAHTGVMVFFVISGFLITNLLLKEWNATGKISLKSFYLRRAFRIFPPFYVYLSIIFALTLAGVFHTPLRAFFFAAIYSINYYLGPGGGFVGVQHIWSLSTEEQFYLLWPAVLLLTGRRRSIYFATCLILISPFSRIVTYQILAPENRAMVNRMFHSSLDTIMFGCLLALLWRSDRFNRLMRPFIGPSMGSWVMGGSVFFLIVIDPFLDYRFHGVYGLIAGMTLEGVAISLILLHVVRRPETLSGRFLNLATMRHIGIISYSLYLWQNILIGELGRYFPYDLLAVLAAAELSYWVVERPALRLRERMGKWLKTRKVAAPQPAN
jgi:peptidoglycan/LPS O-acetylase OafA/YrhL